MKKTNDIDALWSEIDATDWRRAYRGVFTKIGQERGMSRGNVWRALFRTRTVEIGIRAIELKRAKDRQIAKAIKKLGIETTTNP